MKNKLLSTIIIPIVEAVLITVMLLLPLPIPTRVRILDICVLSIIWMTLCYDLFHPLIKTAFKNAPEYGSLGVRWSMQIFYVIVSIAFAVIGATVPIAFIFQLLGQCLLFGILLSAFFYGSIAGRQVTKIAVQQEKVLNGRQQMKEAIHSIQDEIAVGNFPGYFCTSVGELDDALHYIAPSDSSEAIKYEKQFTEIAQKVRIAMTNYNMNEESIKLDLLHLHRILKNRKNICE